MHASGVPNRKWRRCTKRLDRFELDREGQGVAEGAVGVREAAEQGGVLVVVGGADHAAVAGQDLHLGHGLVRHAVAQRSGLDAQPGDGAAEGDRLELGDDQRHEPVPERGVAQVLVGRHAADPRGPAVRVDPQYVVERGQTPGRARPPGPAGSCDPRLRGTGTGWTCAWPAAPVPRRPGRVGLTQLATATSCESAVMRTSFRLGPAAHDGNDRGRIKDTIHTELDEPSGSVLGTPVRVSSRLIPMGP